MKEEMLNDEIPVKRLYKEYITDPLELRNHFERMIADDFFFKDDILKKAQKRKTVKDIVNIISRD
jgi:hypothetical protein